MQQLIGKTASSNDKVLHLVMVAIEGPVARMAQYVEEAGIGKNVSLSFVDCFSDPRGWRSLPAQSKLSCCGGEWPLRSATLESTRCFESVRAAIDDVMSNFEKGREGASGSVKTVVCIDSASDMILRGSVQDFLHMVNKIRQVVKISLLAVVYTDLHPPDLVKALTSDSDGVLTVSDVEKHTEGNPLQAPDGRDGEAVYRVFINRIRENASVSQRAALIGRRLVDQSFFMVETEYNFDKSSSLHEDESSQRTLISSLGLSFNLQLSDVERAQRASVQLPFQQHLNHGPSQDRGKTAGDVEDALEILEDQEDEDEDEEDEEDEDEEKEEDDEEDDEERDGGVESGPRHSDSNGEDLTIGEMRRILECHDNVLGGEGLVDAGGSDLCEERRMDEEGRREVVWKDFKQALGRRSFVYKLDLSKQGWKKLPPEIGRLNKVEVCDLSQNDLDHDGLPEEFFDLYRMRVLDLSYNRFKRLPACICSFLDLTLLDIRGNELQDPRAQANSLKQLFPDCQVLY